MPPSQISRMTWVSFGRLGLFMKISGIALGALALSLASPAFAVDERYPDYAPRAALAGTVEIAGAPAPRSLMLIWPEGFRVVQPDVRIVDAKRGASASSVKIRAAIEALAILVHKDNPLACISLLELETIYTSENPTWGDAGATGTWAGKPIKRFARDADDDGFFVERVLSGAPVAAGVEMLARASILLKRIAQTPGGVGYAPAGYRGEEVRPLQISDGGDCAAPTAANASRADYPLARFVYLEGSTDAAGLAFFDYVLSQQGQRDAVIAGQFPLPYIYAGEKRRKLGLR